ncbi:uncharacterized protein [Halyomorpha halys]|uniref:uncharacterized protein n=1 Tax=Halyomorpha halys TaxID=286706 RepID=UPI0034D15710
MTYFGVRETYFRLLGGAKKPDATREGANQFAYQAGKSTISVLYCLVKKIENSLDNKEIAFCAFMDIEGPFDNTSHETIGKATRRKGASEATVSWINEMLINRSIIPKVGETELKIKTAKECLEGGVLSPLLWTMVVDCRLYKLTNEGFETIGYADHLAIIIRGKHEETLIERMQIAL